MLVTLRPVESSVCIDHLSHAQSEDSIRPTVTPCRCYTQIHEFPTRRGGRRSGFGAKCLCRLWERTGVFVALLFYNRKQMTSPVSASYFQKLFINQFVSFQSIAALNVSFYLPFSDIHFLFALFYTPLSSVLAAWLFP
jgi:hypothetical protein